MEIVAARATARTGTPIYLGVVRPQRGHRHVAPRGVRRFALLSDDTLAPARQERQVPLLRGAALQELARRLATVASSGSAGVLACFEAVPGASNHGLLSPCHTALRVAAP